ncbi:MAG: hypothetical protein ABIY51_10740 [Ferruginibacter sp.]|jgi:hypothetical protein
MTRVLIVILCMFFGLSCSNSKEKSVTELHERREYWLNRERKYYDTITKMELIRYSTTPPAIPSSRQMLYLRISDTAKWHLNEINDSLFKLTGISYQGVR